MRKSLALLALSWLAASAAGAAAAETPRLAKPASLDSCPGGLVLPDTSACLRLSGSVTAETVVRTGTANQAATRLGSVSQDARARLSADVRVPTELGPLRAYASVRVVDPGLRPGR